MEHWRARHKRNNQQSNAVVQSIKIHEKALSLPCTVTLTRVGPRALDYDNMVYSLKKTRDTIASILIPGLKPGRADGDKRITWIYKQAKGAPKEYALLIDIEFT